MCPEYKLDPTFIETSLGSIRGFTPVIFFIIQVSEDFKNWFFFSKFFLVNTLFGFNRSQLSFHSGFQTCC